MKMRTGFVSNSSSSSYVIAYKTEFLKDFDGLSLPGHPFNSIIQDIGACLVRNVEETYRSVKEYVDDLNGEEASEVVLNLLNQGFIVSTGSISDENYDEIDVYLAHVPLHIEQPNLYIDTEGGY